MPLRAPIRPFLWLLATGVLLVACSAPTMTTGHFAPRHYAQTMDSATSACVRNPACFAPPYGESPLLPWVSRSIAAVRNAAAVLKLLETADLAKIEQVLADCANHASHEVNERLLGKGQRPTRQRCVETFKTEPGGRKVTWGMHLGQEKHRVALECVQRELPELFSDHVSLQPTYRYDKRTKKLELLDPRQVDEWLRDGLFGRLLGTLIPDVVVHAAGDLLNIQAVFDFKFPCPADKPASWHEYHREHPYYPSNQKSMYREAFIVEPRSVRPAFGVGP